MSDKVSELSEQDFDSGVIRSDLPVLVDFWAPWCGPCRMVSPVLESIASERVGSVKVVKVNVDENQALAGRFGIRGIPTVMLFDGGEVKETIVGARPKSDFEAMIDRHAGVPAN